MRTIILAAIAVALAGCGYYHWHKDGANTAAFQSDSSGCEQQTGTGAPPSQASGGQTNAGDRWTKCMTDRGWVYSSGW